MTHPFFPQPQPQPQPLAHAHLLHFLSPSSTSSSSSMGEQTLSQTPSSTTQSLSPPSSDPTPAPNPPSPSPSPSSPKDLSITNPPSSSKLPFRPKKIRKLSSSSSSSDPSSKRPATSASIVAVGRPLSADGEVSAALRHLRAADPHLSAVIDVHDPPTFQCFQPPFHCLARSILYQQLAFKAAASIYGRFLSLCGGEAGVVPEAVLALSPHQLRQIGVSGRKAGYLHDLARKYHTGILSDGAIVAMDDRSLFSMLTMVKGIGAWSVHMFMIFSLHRPDVLPVGDLGVRKGVQLLYGLEDVPRPSQMEQLCERWRPYRSVGAWYMWRLVENKGGPTVASTTGTVGVQQQQPQAQLIDPIQMLPSLG